MRFAQLKIDDHSTAFFRLEHDMAHMLSGPPWSGGTSTIAANTWTEDQLLCPVMPSKIVCVGRNYAGHAKELGNDVPTEPLLFFKPPSALIGPNQEIVLPKESSRVEHEAELGVVIGKRCRSVSREEALDYVFGYTCVNDVTARDLEDASAAFERGTASWRQATPLAYALPWPGMSSVVDAPPEGS